VSDRPNKELEASPAQRVLLAREAVQKGEPERAVAELSSAARQHADGGDVADASHCLSQAATIARLAGDLDGAREMAASALEWAGGDDALARAAAVELAEIELLREIYPKAAEHLARARSHDHGASRELCLAMAMKHAEAHLLSGQGREAEEAWSQALELADDDAAACAVLLARRATLLQAVGSPGAPAAILRAKLVADVAHDRGALADLALLDCAVAIDEHDPARAIRAATNAVEHALACGDVTTFVSAGSVLWRLHETNGDRLAAFQSARGSLSRLLPLVGEEMAVSAIAPFLSEMRESWGAEAFDAIRAEADEISASR